MHANPAAACSTPYHTQPLLHRYDMRPLAGCLGWIMHSTLSVHACSPAWVLKWLKLAEQLQLTALATKCLYFLRDESAHGHTWSDWGTLEQVACLQGGGSSGSSTTATTTAAAAPDRALDGAAGAGSDGSVKARLPSNGTAAASSVDPVHLMVSPVRTAPGPAASPTAIVAGTWRVSEGDEAISLPLPPDSHSNPSTPLQPIPSPAGVTPAHGIVSAAPAARLQPKLATALPKSAGGSSKPPKPSSPARTVSPRAHPVQRVGAQKKMDGPGTWSPRSAPLTSHFSPRLTPGESVSPRVPSGLRIASAGMKKATGRSCLSAGPSPASPANPRVLPMPIRPAWRSGSGRGGDNSSSTSPRHTIRYAGSRPNPILKPELAAQAGSSTGATGSSGSSTCGSNSNKTVTTNTDGAVVSDVADSALQSVSVQAEDCGSTCDNSGSGGSNPCSAGSLAVCSPSTEVDTGERRMEAVPYWGSDDVGPSSCSAYADTSSCAALASDPCSDSTSGCDTPRQAARSLPKLALPALAANIAAAAEPLFTIVQSVTGSRSASAGYASSPVATSGAPRAHSLCNTDNATAGSDIAAAGSSCGSCGAHEDLSTATTHPSVIHYTPATPAATVVTGASTPRTPYAGIHSGLSALIHAALEAQVALEAHEAAVLRPMGSPRIISVALGGRALPPAEAAGLQGSHAVAAASVRTGTYPITGNSPEAAAATTMLGVVRRQRASSAGAATDMYARAAAMATAAAAGTANQGHAAQEQAATDGPPNQPPARRRWSSLSGTADLPAAPSALPQTHTESNTGNKPGVAQPARRTSRPIFNIAASAGGAAAPVRASRRVPGRSISMPHGWAASPLMTNTDNLPILSGFKVEQVPGAPGAGRPSVPRAAGHSSQRASTVALVGASQVVASQRGTLSARPERGASAGGCPGCGGPAHACGGVFDVGAAQSVLSGLSSATLRLVLAAVRDGLAARVSGLQSELSSFKDHARWFTCK